MCEKVVMFMGLTKGTDVDAYCVVGHPLGKSEYGIVFIYLCVRCSVQVANAKIKNKKCSVFSFN